VIVLFDGGGDDALDADSVAAHYDGNLFAVGHQNISAHRFGILRAEFEDMPNLHGRENFQPTGVAARTGFTGVDRAQVGPLIDFDIAFDVHAANVMVVFVRAGCHVAAPFEANVGDDEKIPIRFSRVCFSAHTP